MFRRNQSEADRRAEIQRHAETILFQFELLAPAIEADQVKVVEKCLKDIELAALEIPRHYRRNVADLVSRSPDCQYVSGLVDIYRTFNQMVIHNEHDHLHGRDRQPDRA